jgi:hypothetical protein
MEGGDPDVVFAQPKRAWMRWRISSAALLVKVTARMFQGATPFSWTK